MFQVLMMVGLPGCGKTTWAEKNMTENSDKRFNIMGTNNIIEKMKVMRRYMLLFFKGTLIMGN